MTEHQLLAWYQGRYKNLSVKTLEGPRLQIPMSRLRTMITASGLYGNFEISVQSPGTLLQLKRLQPKAWLDQ